MSIHKLISALQEKNIRLWVEEGKLRFQAPKGAMSDVLKQEMSQHKQALITLLSKQQNEHVQINTESEGMLSFSQQRLLFMSETFGASTAYNMPSVYRIRGDLDVTRLQSSIAYVIARHEALRSRFHKEEGGYRVEVLEDVPSLLELRDVSQDGDAEQAITAALQHVFDLSSSLLVHFTLIKVETREFCLVVNIHHSVSDGWSHRILWNDLWKQYANDKEIAIPEREQITKYSEYVAWQNNWLGSHEYQRQQTFWEEYLTGANELTELPLDHVRPAEPDYKGRVVNFSLPDNVSKTLTRFNRNNGCSDFISLLSALFILLNKYSGQRDICIGTTVANRRLQAWEDVVGFFANVVTLRTQVDGTQTLKQLTEKIRGDVLNAFENQDFPFEKVVERLQPDRNLSYSPLFQVMFIFEEDSSAPAVPNLDISTCPRDLGVSKFDLTLKIKREGDSLIGGIEYSTALFNEATIERLAQQFCRVVAAIAESEDTQLLDLSLYTDVEKQALLHKFDGPKIELDPSHTVHERILAKASEHPERIALKDDEQTLTYQELVYQSQSLAQQLMDAGVQPGDRVGVALERNVNVVVAMLATMLAGAAYVPIDVNFPETRKQHIYDDADLRLVITQRDGEKPFTQSQISTLCFEPLTKQAMPINVNFPSVRSQDLAYLIYTSGSTGRPKGVMISHANVVNLFHGLDHSVGESLEDIDGVPCFRALTSVSFDISVLELFWSLARGFQVIVERDHFAALAEQRASQSNPVSISKKAKALDFSLFYFASDQKDLEDPYSLLKEGAKFADANGLSAIWMPERHFHSFGGQFANPSITAAAVSALTKNIEIRAGSVVLPLHHPVRVAEEWSMVDNLSNGRAALAFASGWHFNDFVLAPENFENRHQILRESIEKVKKLWAGETLTFTDGKGNPSDVEIFPKPKRGVLPIWITSAANPETFKFAGSIGANLLTHFLGQSVTELKEKIALYRKARQENGFDPDTGKVTLMLHTYLSDDHQQAMQKVEKPFKDYLRNSINLLLPIAKSNGLDAKGDLEAVVEAGFQRYAKTSALFGTPESRLSMLNELADIDVNEIACLVDFGVEQQAVVQNFKQISRLKKMLTGEVNKVSINTERATHIQCTPSYAQLLLDSENIRESLKGIQGFFVGGEPLTPSLAKSINDTISGSLFNMYGPTETTVWSAVNKVIDDDAHVGLPIANTQLYVLDEHMQPLPPGVQGELYIAGDGVAQGYWKRPDLTAANFLPNPFSDVPGSHLYRTGDLVKRLDDGRLVFLGRIDNQEKVRGYRIELDEIREALESYPGVTRAAVRVYRGEQKEASILGYVLPDTRASQPISITKILESLKSTLPSYMIPNGLFVLKEWPYTPNGKLDLKALPTQVVESGKKLVPAANYVEAKVMGIWKDLLNLDDCGTQDSFFELGGHSLLLGKMQQKLQEQFSVKIELIDLFRYPTISCLSKRIDEGVRVKTNITQAERKVRRESVNQIRNQMRLRNRRGN